MVGNVNSQSMRQQWTQATAELPYGVQRVFHDILQTVAEGLKEDLVYSADYRDSNGACLVNSASAMLKVGGGHGVPMKAYGEVVSAFDQINNMLYEQGYNTPNYVSPEAAEVLLQWFGELKDPPTPEEIEAAKAEAFAKNHPYVEPTDEDMAKAFEEMLTAPALPEPTPFDDTADAPADVIFVSDSNAKFTSDEEPPA